MAVIKYARSGYARSGATRSGYYREQLQATIAGIDRATKFEKGKTKIKRTLNESPNTATFSLFGVEPPLGAEVIIGNGSLSNRLFGGNITDRKQASVKQSGGQVAKQLWDVTCSDWIFDLAGEANVLERYFNTPAHLIFRDLATKYAPGYSLKRVKTGGPVIDDIAFDMVTLPSAFTQLGNRCDPTWHWDCDPYKVLHFFDYEELVAQPKPITTANLDYNKLDYQDSLRLVRTQVTVVGGGGSATAPTAAGSTSHPVDECGWYDTPGRFKSGSQICTYTGRSASSGPGNLTGIPAAGAGAILFDIKQGDQAYIVVIEDDLAAQAALQAVMGGTGIRKYNVRDGTLGVAGARVRAMAELAMYRSEIKSGGYTAHDNVLDAGRFATINLPNRTASLTSVQIPIDEVEIIFESPNRTIRRAQFTSAVRIDLTDIIRSIGKSA